MHRASHNVTPGGRPLTLALSLASALLLAGGLIYLLAGLRQPRYLVVSLLLVATGAAMAIWSGRRWQRARQLAPQFLDARIVRLAAKQDAQVTLAEVIGSLDVPEKHARAALERMAADSLCHQETRDSGAVFAFPGLQESKVVRQCAYCGSTFSVREPLQKCSSCGGDLQIVKN